MPGPAPKPAHLRRNRNEKMSGEWKQVTGPVGKPPKMPARGEGRGKWSSRTTRAWKAWWSDPVSSEWTTSDKDLVEHLADVYEEWVREPQAAKAGEVRQVREHLGLTPKGRQGRRWTVGEPAEVVDLPQGSAADRMAELRTNAAKAGRVA